MENSKELTNEMQQAALDLTYYGDLLWLYALLMDPEVLESIIDRDQLQNSDNLLHYLLMWGSASHIGELASRTQTMFQAVLGYYMGTQPLPAPHVQIVMHQYMDFHVARERRVQSNLEWGLDPRENDTDFTNDSLRVIPAYVDQNHQIEDFNWRFSLIPV